ncbi:MAG: bacillithiol biosynthesis deacetylase BshB1 [Bacteroidota bacterium]|nr:bacillithiol biosynthesis deacetylase BshB1 [Bacteroidota bacterium]
MKLDILAFGAHPDDVELGVGGILATHATKGLTTGIVDLTKGEMGTRGTAEIRLEEANKAAEILGCAFRENLGMSDGHVNYDHKSQLNVATIIRKYRPNVVLMNAPTDRHPDHGRASRLVEESCFLAGLHKIQLEVNGIELEPWRPKNMYKYLQFYNLEPQVVVDISTGFEKKMASIRAHKSQFFNPDSEEPQTLISSERFFQSVIARAQDWGRIIGADYAEPLIAVRHVGVGNLNDLQ